MKSQAILAAAVSVLALSGAAFAQSSAVGPAPGVPEPEAQSGSTNPPGGNQGSKSEREARDQLGAERATGDQLGPPSGMAPNNDQVRRMLEKRGYSDIRDLKQEGDTYTGRAVKDGRNVELRVDPQQAQIEETGG